MNTFYFDDKTEKIVKEKPQNSYIEIKTSKSYEQFIADYEQVRKDGNSIINSIKWSK